MPGTIALVAALALTVVDVDTVRLGGSRLRLAGLDGPEASDACAADIRAGGTAALQRRIEGAALVEIDFIGHGRWRHIVRLLLDGRDPVPQLVAEGWARPYDGTRRDLWCACPVDAMPSPAIIAPPAPATP